MYKIQMTLGNVDILHQNEKYLLPKNYFFYSYAEHDFDQIVQHFYYLEIGTNDELKPIVTTYADAELNIPLATYQIVEV